MFTQWALRPDSAGAGTHRGGLGAIYEIEALADGARSFLLGERGKYPPFGVDGGGSGRAQPLLVADRTAAGSTPPLASKVTDVQDPRTASASGWRRRAAAAGANPRRATAAASRATCGSAMSARPARVTTYEVVLAADGCVDEQPTGSA